MSLLSKIIRNFRNKKTKDSLVDTPKGKVRWDKISYFVSKPFDIKGKICSSCYRGHCPR